MLLLLIWCTSSAFTNISIQIHNGRLLIQATAVASVGESSCWRGGERGVAEQACSRFGISPS